MDNLKLDADALRSVADTVNIYAKRQKDVMNNFLSNVSNLGSEWQDDETFYSLIQEIMKLRSEVCAKMDVVNAYANIFRERALVIDQRPKYGQSSSGTGNNSSAILGGTSNISSQHRTYSSADVIMQKNGFDKTKLCSDICEVDGVGKVENYVSICVDLSKISNLEHPGTFLSPATGEPIYAKRIAYRGHGICTPNTQNVCGADFYYKDGTFCGSYTGTSWQDIFDNNYADTKKFRK